MLAFAYVLAIAPAVEAATQTFTAAKDSEISSLDGGLEAPEEP
jgi:hypothetical protein